MAERGHVNHLDITVQRTWCGKTRARITGTTAGRTVDVTVTGWRRASVLAEAQATFDAVAADLPLPRPKGHPMLRVFLLSLLLTVGLPTVAGAPGHREFNDGVPLDASQVVDTRAFYGELICRVGDVVPDDCDVDMHRPDTRMTILEGDGR